jgi:hypothetical protein
VTLASAAFPKPASTIIGPVTTIRIRAAGFRRTRLA